MKAALIALAICLALWPGSARSTPLTGRWEGVFHGGRADQPVALIIQSSAGGRLAGLLYLDGSLIGSLERGTASGDSLRFNVMSFEFRGRRDGKQLALVGGASHGRAHDLALQFVSPDTSALLPSPAAAAAARSRILVAWDQVPDSVFAAHRVATDSPPGISEELRKGTLFLVGGGPSQDDLDAEFLRLAGGPEANVVVIPTATIDPGSASDPLLQANRWATQLGTGRVTVLHTGSRAIADADSFVAPLRAATGVWLSGGEAGRILVSYLGTRTERELLALLARGGVIGGTSAGALVWGSECQVFRAPKDGSPFQMGSADALLLDDPHSSAFGVLRNVVVAPHFTEFKMQPSMEKTLAARPHLMGIGIDEATAFEVHGNIGEVLGRGHVAIFDGKDHAGAKPLILSAGARYDLARKAGL